MRLFRELKGFEVCSFIFKINQLSGLLPLEVQHLVATLQCRCGQITRIAPVGCQKSSLRMRFYPLGRAVMPAHGFLNLTQNRDPLRPWMPLPKQDKSLSAHAAVELSVSARALAKYLHFSTSPSCDAHSISPVTIVDPGSC
jgi:hypothetical protein